ncbi:MAG: hypothetical protein N3I86_00800, partial [Verrucomicrobiae bacterium]|nr:hypothetical protein [Verrucomicrobiae bacterium]
MRTIRARRVVRPLSKPAQFPVAQLQDEPGAGASPRSGRAPKPIRRGSGLRITRRRRSRYVRLQPLHLLPVLSSLLLGERATKRLLPLQRQKRIRSLLVFSRPRGGLGLANLLQNRLLRSQRSRRHAGLHRRRCRRCLPLARIARWGRGRRICLLPTAPVPC